jgi:hypothetical protein
VSAALPAAAQDLPIPIRIAVGCGPQAAAASESSDMPRIVGIQDPTPRSLYGPRDLVIVDAGANRGIQMNQRFFVRRNVVSHDTAAIGPRPSAPSGLMGFVRRNVTPRGGAAPGARVVLTSG